MLPIIIGASVGIGVYNIISALEKEDEAQKNLEEIKNKFNLKKSQLENTQETLVKSLKELDRLYSEVYNKDFVKFEKILKKLEIKLAVDKKNSHKKIFDKINKEISVISEKKISLNLEENSLENVVLFGKSVALSYSGVRSIIGKFGIASGLSVAGLGLTFAATVVIFGIEKNIMAEEHLTEVLKQRKEVEKILAEIDKGIAMLSIQIEKIQQYTNYFIKIRERFLKSLTALEEVINKHPKSKMKKEIKKKLNTSSYFARTLRKLMDNPLDINLKEVKL